MKFQTISVFFILLILLACFGCAGQGVPQTAAEWLSLGEKYLLELDYEQAIVAFLNVIEIEPRNARGYTGAAEAYAGLGDTEKALSILQDGLSVLPGNTELLEMREQVQAQAAAVSGTSAMAEARDAASPGAPGQAPAGPPDSSSTASGESGQDTELDYTVYLNLPAGQKEMFQTLKTDLVAMDFEAVFNLLLSEAFVELCETLPADSGDTTHDMPEGYWTKRLNIPDMMLFFVLSNPPKFYDDISVKELVYDILLSGGNMEDGYQINCNVRNRIITGADLSRFSATERDFNFVFIPFKGGLGLANGEYITYQKLVQMDQGRSHADVFTSSGHVTDGFLHGELITRVERSDVPPYRALIVFDRGNIVSQGTTTVGGELNEYYSINMDTGEPDFTVPLGEVDRINNEGPRFMVWQPWSVLNP